MARSKLGLLPALVLATLAAPAAAQFGSIFGPPPRPPGDVPYPRFPVDPRLPQEPQYDPRYERERPQPPPPPLTRLPPPPRDGVQSQPLPPPPGGAMAPPSSAAPPSDAAPSATEAARAPITGPGQPPLVGLPPGQRQPRGSPQQGSTTDEVVVAPPKQKIVNPTAVFAGLDKITGRIISFEVAIEETVQFGALRLTPRACYTRPPTEPPNTDGFVEIDEITLQGEVKRIFTGWMFAASPGLHGVEHPIYDVWLTGCKHEAPQVASAQGTEPAPSQTQTQAQPADVEAMPQSVPRPPPRPAELRENPAPSRR